MEPFHTSKQEWEYYRFANIPDAIRWLNKQLKNEKFSPLIWDSIRFIEYGDESAIGILKDFTNN